MPRPFKSKSRVTRDIRHPHLCTCSTKRLHKLRLRPGGIHQYRLRLLATSYLTWSPSCFALPPSSSSWPRPLPAGGARCRSTSCTSPTSRGASASPTGSSAARSSSPTRSPSRFRCRDGLSTLHFRSRFLKIFHFLSTYMVHKYYISYLLQGSARM